MMWKNCKLSLSIIKEGTKESVFSSWGDETMAHLPVKSDGRTVMTSDFVTVVDGIVRYNDEVWETLKDDPAIEEEIKDVGDARARQAGVILDTVNDGYYRTASCIPDFEKVFKNCLLWREFAVPLLT